MRASPYGRFARYAAFPLAALLAARSLGGLLFPAVYAREAPAWIAQAIGQDWFDLVVAAPWLVICGVAARKGSYRWGVLLAGAYAYTAYEMFIYAFAVHFNAFFLVYCATLGLAGFALVKLAIELQGRARPLDRRGGRLAGAFLIALGVVFGLMWLAEDIPAIVRNAPPRTLEETGLFTNPVHVIDLAFVLPAHVLAGLLAWRGRRSGDVFALVILAFGILMAASIGGMLVVMQLSGVSAPRVVTVAMLGLAVIAASIYRVCAKAIT